MRRSARLQRSSGWPHQAHTPAFMAFACQLACGGKAVLRSTSGGSLPPARAPGKGFDPAPRPLWTEPERSGAPQSPRRRPSMNLGQANSDSETSPYVVRGEAPLYRELAVRLGAETRYTATASQIHGWVTAGLLPNTPTESLGWGRGFRAEPSEELFAQLVAVCRLREVTDRTDRLRMLLWLEGWPVDPLAIKRAVLARLAFLPRRKPSAVRGMDDLNHQAQRRAQSFVRHLGLHPIGRKTAVDGVFVAASIVIGAEVEIGQRSVELLLRAFGLDRAMSDRTHDTGPWLVGDVARDLSRLARARPLTRLYDRVATLTSVQIEEVRPYARFVALDLPLFARALEVRFGHNAFGFGGLRIVRGRPEIGIAVAAYFYRTRLRRQLDGLSRTLAENRDLMLQMVGDADGADV